MSIDDDAEFAAKQAATAVNLANAWMCGAMAAGRDHLDLLLAAEIVRHRIQTRGDLPSEVLAAAKTLAAKTIEMLDDLDRRRAH